MRSGFALGKNQELALTGTIKAAVMILIVLYHSCALWLPGGWFNQPPVEPNGAIGVFALWLNTIHVPVFVFVSGYIYSYLKRETHKYDSSKVVLQKKAKRLLVPYAFACLFWVAPFNALFFGWEGTLSKYLLATAPSQLWFLVMLFVLFCVFEALHHVVPKTFAHPKATFVALLLICYAGALLGLIVRANLFQALSAMAYAPIFYAGYYARERGLQSLWSKPLWAIAIGEIALFCIWLCCSQSGVIVAKAAALLLQPFVRLAGVALALSVLVRFFARRSETTPGGGCSSNTVLASTCFISRLSTASFLCSTCRVFPL